MPYYGRGCRISTLIMIPISFWPNSDLFKTKKNIFLAQKLTKVCNRKVVIEQPLFNLLFIRGSEIMCNWNKLFLREKLNKVNFISSDSILLEKSLRVKKQKIGSQIIWELVRKLKESFKIFKWHFQVSLMNKWRFPSPWKFSNPNGFKGPLCTIRL